MSEDKATISIVVTSYTTDRLKDVFHLLDSIKQQTYPNIETIFVAERSTELYDRVKDYAQEKAIPNVKVLFNDGEPGASAARNLGINHAQGDIIGFTDDDAVLFPDWAQEMVNTYQDSSIIGATGAILPLWQDESMSWLPEEFHWIISCSSWLDCNEIKEVRNVWTTNASFRREAFNPTRLFLTSVGPRGGSQAGRSKTIPEDVEIGIRIRQDTGKRIVYNPGVKVKHKVYRQRFKLANMVQWAYWMGLYKHKLKRMYPQAGVDENPLGQEHQLLKRIFTRLLPNILKNLFRKPAIAWRQLFFTVFVLFFVALGYFRDLLSSSFKMKGAS